MSSWDAGTSPIGPPDRNVPNLREYLNDNREIAGFHGGPREELIARKNRGGTANEKSLGGHRGRDHHVAEEGEAIETRVSLEQRGCPGRITRQGYKRAVVTEVVQRLSLTQLEGAVFHHVHSRTGKGHEVIRASAGRETDVIKAQEDHAIIRVARV